MRPLHSEVRRHVGGCRWLSASIALAVMLTGACSGEILTPVRTSVTPLPDSIALMVAGLDSLAADVTRQAAAMRFRAAPQDEIARLEDYATELQRRATALRESAARAYPPPSFTEYPEYEPDNPDIGIALPETKTDVSIAGSVLSVESAWKLPGILSHRTSLAYNVDGTAMNHTYEYEPTSAPLMWIPKEWTLPSRLNCTNSDAAADAQSEHWWSAEIRGFGLKTVSKQTEDYDSCEWKPSSVVVTVGTVDMRNGMTTTISTAVRKRDGSEVTDCPIYYASSPDGAFTVDNSVLKAITSGPMSGYVVATCRGVSDAVTIKIHEDCSLDQNLIPLFSCNSDGGTDGGGGGTEPPPPSTNIVQVCWPQYRYTVTYYPGYPEATTWEFTYIGDYCTFEAVESRTASPVAADLVTEGSRPATHPPSGTGRRLRLVRKDSLPDGAPIAVLPAFEIGEDVVLVAPHASRSDLALALAYADSVLKTAPATSQRAHIMRAHGEVNHGFWFGIAGAFMSELEGAAPLRRGKLAGMKSAVVAMPRPGAPKRD